MNLEKMIDSFKHTVLSQKHNVFVVDIDFQKYAGMENEEREIPEEYKRIRVVFSRTTNQGIILGKTYYVKANFFKGGKDCNVFIEQEIDLIVKTFLLEKAVPIEGDITNKMIAMDALLMVAEKEVDITRLEEIKNEAKILAEELQNDHSTKIFNKISARFIKVSETQKSGFEEMKTDLLIIVDTIKKSEDEMEIQKLLLQGSALLTKLPAGDNEVRSAAVFLNELIKKSESGKLKEKDPEDDEDPEDKKRLSDKEMDELQKQDFLKRAEKAFDARDYTKATNLYKQVQKIDPDNNVAKEKLQQIATLKNKK